MIYDHMVKVNGQYYQAGEDVPEIEDMAGNENSLPFSDTAIEFEEDSAGKRYTKTDIRKMSTADLQALATEVGIENAFETSGEKLKEILIKTLGL